MERLDEEEIASVLVCEVYCLYAEDAIESDQKVKFADLIEKCRAVLAGQSIIGRNLSKLALAEAQRKRHIEVTDYPFDQDYTELVITPAGFQFVREAKSAGYEPVISYLSRRRDFVSQSEALDSRRDTGITAASESEDAWAPLPVDRTSKDYEYALRTLEEVRDEFRGENGFAATDPDKKLAVLDALDHGIDVFKTKVLTRATLDSLLVQPLKFIVKTFGSASVAELAKLAVSALKKLFEL